MTRAFARSTPTFSVIIHDRGIGTRTAAVMLPRLPLYHDRVLCGMPHTSDSLCVCRTRRRWTGLLCTCFVRERLTAREYCSVTGAPCVRVHRARCLALVPGVWVWMF